MKPEEIKALQEENKSLKGKLKKANADLKKREDTIAEQAAEVEKLTTDIAAANQVAEAKKPIMVVVGWKSPQGKAIKKEVTITNPKVRIDPAKYPVSARGLLKIANEKTPEEDEMPGLENVSKEQAIELITKWTKIQAGFIQEKEKEEKK